jgi:Protein of unknown function (DUF2380)
LAAPSSIGSALASTVFAVCRKRAEHRGTVTAPDEQSTILEAIKQFEIDQLRQNRIAVSKIDEAQDDIVEPKPRRTKRARVGDIARAIKAPALAAFLAFCMSGVPNAATDDVPQVAFFGFQLINTSLEPTSPAEAQRIRMLDDLFQQRLDASDRFKIVPIPPNLRQEITAGPEISNCNGCQRDWARKVGADWAAWGTVQKVSNLILNINVYMEDARTGKLQFVKSVDIRGNSDETWRRGLDYMLGQYLLRDP